MTCEGISAHGSTPEQGANAVIRLFEALKENDFGGDLQTMINFLMEKIGYETNGEKLELQVQMKRPEAQQLTSE